MNRTDRAILTCSLPLFGLGAAVIYFALSPSPKPTPERQLVQGRPLQRVAEVRRGTPAVSSPAVSSPAVSSPELAAELPQFAVPANGTPTHLPAPGGEVYSLVADLPPPPPAKSLEVVRLPKPSAPADAPLGTVPSLPFSPSTLAPVAEPLAVGISRGQRAEADRWPTPVEVSAAVEEQHARAMGPETDVEFSGAAESEHDGELTLQDSAAPAAGLPAERNEGESANGSPFSEAPQSAPTATPGADQSALEAAAANGGSQYPPHDGLAHERTLHAHRAVNERPPLVADTTTLATVRESRRAPAPARPAPAAIRVDAVTEQGARRLVDEGASLANRGATYSSRNKFHRALSVIAEARDIQAGGSEHLACLGRAQRAFREADDFVTSGNFFANSLNVAELVTIHDTPVLKGKAADCSPLLARQAYYVYAQEQLALAVGDSPAGSLALFGLGKLHLAIAHRSSEAWSANAPRALAFQQAALRADSANHRAANEIGVLLARVGKLREARALLQHSARLNASREVWENLAVVHQKLGEHQLAQHATAAANEAPSALTVAPAGAPSKALVRWVDPQTFARSGGAASPIPQGRQTAADVAPQTPVEVAPQSTAWEWIAWQKRSR